jgi:hypothetical protein
MTHSLRVSAFLTGLFLLPACDRSDPSAPTTAKSKATHADSDHEHVAAHGGVIAVVGNAHAELAETANQALAIYILGEDEAVTLPIAAATLSGQLQKRGTADFVEVEFTADPLPGEAPKSSRFVSAPNQFERGVAYDMTTYLPIDGKNYRARFVAFGATHDDHGGPGSMEARNAAASSERTPKVVELWFTPKAKYTADDIAANGPQTAYEKFGEVEVDHQDPTPGEIVCPISKSKTNPEITWIIDGKKYAFCCPPCIEDLVQRAKDKPDELKPPEGYVKQ